MILQIDLVPWQSLPMAPLRRAPVPLGTLLSGPAVLPRDTAHYVYHVLRLRPGDSVELFDGAGQVAEATLQTDAGVHIGPIRVVPDVAPRLVLAVAVPKGDRADWLVEKATELGVTRLCWLICTRSVVLPKGSGRMARWQRVAEAAARQAGRNTVLHVDGPVPMAQFVALDRSPNRWIAQPGAPALQANRMHVESTLLVGPEGGFTGEELQQAVQAGYTAASLSRTILRVETAALAGAALLLAPTS